MADRFIRTVFLKYFHVYLESILKKFFSTGLKKAAQTKKEHCEDSIPLLLNYRGA